MCAATIWPDLPYSSWRDTAATLQLWTQIVGKVRLQSTYRAAADLGKWDPALECAIGVPGRPRALPIGAPARPSPRATP